MYLIGPNAPKSLSRMQAWVGDVLHMPCFELDQNRLPILDEKTKKEAGTYIRPSSTLRADQRIAIYNQQYWWRLLKILKKDFPFVLRLFGEKGFETTLAIPYLLAHPPSHWSLYLLGEKFPSWIEKNYPEKKDKKLVHHAAILDRSFSRVFFEKEYLPIQEVDLNQVIYLQPYIELFAFEADLFSFRKTMIKQEVDYWLNHELPNLHREKKYYFILFRHTRKIQYLTLKKYEYDLLSVFQKGAQLQKALDTIEDFPHLDRWFKRCMRLKWLTYKHEEYI